MNKEARFKTIFESHYQKVFRLCKGYFGGNEALAKDMAQEVFIKAWQNLDSFRGESALSTWIFRITVNTCLSEKRKAVYKQVRKDVFPEDQEMQEYSLIKEKQLHLLYGCINKLKALDKVIIMLVLEATSYQEISEITGMKEASVRVRIHRIKTKLTKCANNDRF
jgi:RNA polymerase sigma factor (sigma-70 family)